MKRALARNHIFNWSHHSFVEILDLGHRRKAVHSTISKCCPSCYVGITLYHHALPWIEENILNTTYLHSKNNLVQCQEWKQNLDSSENKKVCKKYSN